MRHHRLLLWIVALLGAALACSLNTSDEAPTPSPFPTSFAGVPTATGQPAATITPFATLTPLPTAAPSCVPRTDWPSVTVQPGDTLFGIALWTGTTVDQLALANCLANPNAIETGTALYVPRVPPARPTATAIPGCPNPWFFTFEAGARLATDTCPEPVVRVEAFGQDFEGGRVYYYGPIGGDARGTIFVIYNNGYWETYPDAYVPGEPVAGLPEAPPAGRYEPVGQIGKVWREAPGVRDTLGWALEPEQTFTGRLQSLPPGGASHFYVDHGKWGIVLRLYPADMAPNPWEVAGRY